MKSIDEIYNNLSKEQKDILKEYSVNAAIPEKEYLEELLIDKEYATKLADYVNKNRWFYLKQIDPEDIKYLILYFGIGVNKRSPEEVFILSKYPKVIPLDTFIEGANTIIANSTNELLSIYDAVMEALSIDNKEKEMGKGFSL